MSYPLGLRAKLKGPQVHKKVLMKPQVSTFYIQVRLPAAMQRLLAAAIRGGADSDLRGGDGNVRRVTTSPSSPGSESAAGSSSSAVRLPCFSEEELLSGSYSTALRGVVTVTVPSVASCKDAIEMILHAVNTTERPAEDYQLVQCFADFSPDHTRRRLTGDSSSMPIKTVMQFPFHLALVVSPYVVLREALRDEDEPRERQAIADEHRKVCSLFFQGYQALLFRLIEQSNFLRGREEEGRRGKKLEERQQYFELVRFRTLKQETEARRFIERNEEYFSRCRMKLECLALSEKYILSSIDADGVGCESWGFEHAVFLRALRSQHDEFVAHHRLRERLCQRMQNMQCTTSDAARNLEVSKQHLFMISAMAVNVDRATAVGLAAVCNEDATRMYTLVEHPRRGDGPLWKPQALVSTV